MVCEGNTPHAISYSLVDQGFDWRLSVQDRILRVDVEMYKWLHTFYFFAFVKLSIHNDILKRKREYIPFLTFVCVGNIAKSLRTSLKIMVIYNIFCIFAENFIRRDLSW